MFIFLQAAAAAGAAAGSAAGPVGAAIGAGVALIGSVLAGVFAKRAQRRQNKANAQLAEYQNALNMQSWQEQQDYNTPANQMARLKAAGLNPNLMYGQGTTGNADSQRASVVPEQTYNNIAGQAVQTGLDGAYQRISTYNSLQMQEEQIRQMQLANERLELEMPYLQNGYYLKWHGVELRNKAIEENTKLLTQRYDEVQERIQGIKLHNKISEKQLDILDGKLLEFAYHFRQLDDMHQTALLDQALKQIDYATKHDEYKFGMELTRIQGRVLSAKSISELDWMDVLKLGIYYLGSIFRIPVGGKHKLPSPSQLSSQTQSFKIGSDGKLHLNSTTLKKYFGKDE